MPVVDLGRVGVWWSGTWRVEGDESVSAAAELEALGFGAIWSSGGFNPGLSARFRRLLSSTRRVTVASGVVNIWRASPAEIATAVGELDAEYPGRFLLGIGTSHGPLIDHYSRPFGHMVEYLDALDQAQPPVRIDQRVLAALRPRMVELARDRSAGAHPYFVPVEHTARARDILGPGPILAPEVTVILEQDSAKARTLARGFTAGYLSLPNYANNLRTLGYDDLDFSGGGSDRLIDGVVAWGDVSHIARRVDEHIAAGADHVCVQVLSPDVGFPLKAYQELAPALVPDR